MTSLKPDSDGARARILEASLDLFSDKGFHATTTRKIAQKAGVNEVTLFRHFNNKMSLFKEVLGEIQKVGFDSDRIKDMDIDPGDLIRLAVEYIFEIFEKHPREIRLLNLALLENVEGFEEEYVVIHANTALDFIADAFRKLQDQKRISSREIPEILAQMLLSQVLEMAAQRIVRKNTPLKKYDRATLCNSIIHLFMS